MDADRITIESANLRLCVSAQTGALTELRDLATDWNLVARPHQGLAFRLNVPLPSHRFNLVSGVDQTPSHVRADETSISLTWEEVTSDRGGLLPITLTQRYTLYGRRAIVATEIDNRSEFTIEEVFSPCLGDLRPANQDDALEAIHPSYGGAARRSLWPRFVNTAGYWGVDFPTQLPTGAAALSTPGIPFVLVQGNLAGCFIGVAESTDDIVAWQFQLSPGYADSLQSLAPAGDRIDRHDVALRFSAMQVPFIAPGERRAITPIALEPYQGDWHAGADIYKSWLSERLTPVPSPAWAREPHSWQQLQVNSPEDELRMSFAELVEVGKECSASGVKAIQVVGWNEGGQDRNNPSHRPDPRLGGADGLRDAIRQIQELGVKVVLFTKFTWADQSTARYRRELRASAIKDPYGDPYVHPGYRYQTSSQLLDISTRRLIPMCFLDEEYLEVCASEFATVAELGADGILYDEAFHHSPALLCFDTAHGHRAGAPVYANDRELIRRFRQQIQRADYLFAAEACYDSLLDSYHVTYLRTNSPDHLPLQRYVLPHVSITTAITGFDDRNMINQCLLYRYIASYEPFNFKGRLSDMPRTVAYGRAMDRLRTELRDWFWDGTFTDTVGATVTGQDGTAHHPYAVFRHQRTEAPGVAVANYDADASRSVTVSFPHYDGALRYRTVDDDEWRSVADAITIPPLSAAVILPATGDNANASFYSQRSRF